MPRFDQRRGFLTPIVIFVVIIFAILGVTFMFSTGSDYSQSAHSGYQFRARLLAQAALDELQTIVYDRVCTPPPTAAGGVATPLWRADLLQSLDGMNLTSGTASGPVTFAGSEWKSFAESSGPKLDRVVALIAEIKDGAITQARVHFHGFRRFPYGLGLNDDSYYKHPTLDPGAGGALVPKDYIGYYTMQVTARYKGAISQMEATHDVKIVNIMPMANEFSLFQRLNVPPNQADDLNAGGLMSVVSQGYGRVFMRGPYTVKVHGLPKGEGGQRPWIRGPPQRSPCRSFYDRVSSPDWWGWSGYPNPRAAVIRTGLGSQVAHAINSNWGGAAPQQRPVFGDSTFWSTAFQITRTVANRVTTVNFGGDPACYLIGDSQYFTGCDDVSSQDFSLFGDPLGPLSFHTFRGIEAHLPKTATDATRTGQWEYKEFHPFNIADGRPQTSNAHYLYTGTMLPPTPAAPHWAASGTDLLPNGRSRNRENKEIWYILPEANIKAKYKLVKFKAPQLVGHSGVHGWRLWQIITNIEGPRAATFEDLGFREMPYALAFEPFRGQSFWESFRDALLGPGLAVAGVLTAGVYPALLLGAAAAVASPHLDRFFADSLGSGQSPSAPLGRHSLPPNYKDYGRAASRVYNSADRIASLTGTSRTLTLDGVICVKELKIQRAFRYRGKGIIYCKPEGPDTAQRPGQIKVPIIPVVDRDWEGCAPPNGANPVPASARQNQPFNIAKTSNYLTLIYDGSGREAGSSQAAQGNQMLEVSIDSTPLPAGPHPSSPRATDHTKTANILDGTIYSTQGLKLDTNQSIGIYGNYVCGLVNKSKSRSDAKLFVVYNRDQLRKDVGETPTATRTKWLSADWTAVSVSPRLAGFYEPRERGLE